MSKSAVVVAAVALTFVAAPAGAVELSSEHFRLIAPVISGGGGVNLQSLGGDVHVLGVTLGQSTPPGVLTGPNGLTLEAGFWPIVLLPAGVVDTDQDGIPDDQDNCIETANGPLIPDAGGNLQLDEDRDGYGNVCDCDLDNDGLCNIGDFNLFLDDFTTGSANNAFSDMDGSGAVDIGDFGLFLPGFTNGEPGPSGLVP